MATTDIKFAKKLKKYGAIDFNACFNCGNCTAVCSLSNEKDSFPRDMIRCTVTGQSNDIKGSLKPWLCYYCGECTTHCPMEAKPGELMMSLRRYLTGEYDWTGIAGWLYRNLTAYMVLFLAVALAILGYYQLNADQQLWLEGGHLFEMLAIAAVFLLILLPNLFRMWYFVIGSKKDKIPFKKYVTTLKSLFVHMFTQKRSLDCEEDSANRFWWLEHLILVFSYLLLLFTTVFLDWFASSNIILIAAGYLFSLLIFIITADLIVKRWQKKSEKNTYSHPSDWFFVVWLFLMGFSAFVVRVLIDFDVLKHVFGFYLLHLIILAQWALVIVPFGKWTHFLYRSFAMYFHEVKS